MADGKKLVERKFLLEKKSIKLEDCKLFIEEYHPEKKSGSMICAVSRSP